MARLRCPNQSAGPRRAEFLPVCFQQVGRDVVRLAASLKTMGVARAALGAAVGVSAAGLAVATHMIAGGPVPDATPMGVLGFAAIVAGIALSGLRWRLPLLLGALVGVQAAFHVAFGGLVGAPAHSAQSAHTAHSAQAADSTMATVGLDWRMLVGHVVAVLLTVLVVGRGEQVCRRAAAVLARPFYALRVLLRPIVFARLSSWCALDARPSPLRLRLLLCAAPRRGPPALMAG